MNVKTISQKQSAIISRYFNPNLSDTENARQIYNANEWQHNSENHGRKLVSYYRNNIFIQPKQALTYALDDLLPQSYAKEKVSYILPSHIKSVLLIGDLHLPYYHKESVITALEYGQQKKVDCVYINGDLIDFYAISRFQTCKNERNLKLEIEVTRKFLRALRQLFPTQLIVWKMGNHEERWSAYLNSKAEELSDLDVLQFDKLFHLEQLGIELVGPKTFAKFGNLNTLHGSELGKSVFSPVNSARGLYMKVKESAIEHHVHNTSHHTEKTLNGHIISTWSVGCLSELNPDYMPINKYNHGFAHVLLSDNGNFEVKNYTIIDGRIY